jgi:hypothetical protein
MLTDAGLPGSERRLVDASRTGTLVDLCTGDPEVDAVANARVWDTDRVVRGELLTDLLSGGRGSRDHRPRSVKLRGARITGQLDLEAISAVCPLLLQDCHLDEEINLMDARVPALRLHGCLVPRVLGNRLNTRHNLEFRDGCKVDGGIDLLGAHIGGSLVLDNADLANADGSALQAMRITVDGDVLCRNGFTAHSTVDIVDAHIKGSLDFSGARLHNRDENAALAASRIRVERAVLFRNGFQSNGMVQIRNSRVGVFVDFADAKLTNPNGLALQANNLIVERGISFGAGFKASGKVDLYAVNAFRLGIGGGQFDNPDDVAIDLRHMSAVNLLLLPSQPPRGAVDLSFASATHFSDNPETWPAEFRLRGFTYETLENESVNVQARLRWLELHTGGYVPGIYDQLATAYRHAGRVEASRIVSIAKQKQRRRELSPFGKVWNWLLYVTVGYGYRTWWAGLWLLGLLTVGSVIFAGAYPDSMVPATGVVPPFQPVAYTMDVLVPLVDLGQKKAWIPVGTAMIWSWMLTGSGWLLTTAVVAGLTNAVKRD